MQNVWQRWKELTRFRLACEMALSAYQKSFIELPIRDIERSKIFDENGKTRFECEYKDFLDALNNTSYLYQLLLIAHASLVEEFGRVIIRTLLDDGLVGTSSFPGIGNTTSTSEAAEDYIRRCNVEAWGGAIITVTGRDWTIVPGGLGDVVHAFVVRNIIAHGSKSYNQTAVNRLNGAAPGLFQINAGMPLALEREDFQKHLSRLRNFSRVICGAPTRVKRRAAVAGNVS